MLERERTIRRGVKDKRDNGIHTCPVVELLLDGFHLEVGIVRCLDVMAVVEHGPCPLASVLGEALVLLHGSDEEMKTW